MPKPPILLMVLDGFGLNPKKEGNAIALANAPTFRKLEQGNRCQLEASGISVGLPEGQMGNSEVGHTNIGSGRIVPQNFVRINQSIASGEFFSISCLKQAFETVKKKDSKLHIMGLISDGGIHSHLDHLKALIKFAQQEGVPKLYIHCFLDGRDTPPDSSPEYIRQLKATLEELSYGKIATISGRFYAMDRDKRWNRIKQTYLALTEAKGFHAETALKGIEQAVQRSETDEFVQPTIIDKSGMIEDNDTVIFFNFRADRARQMTRVFTEKNFSEFERSKKIVLSDFLTMTEVDKSFTSPIIFPPLHLTNVLGEILSKNNIPQLRIAETEKYAHVTFFFNGGEEQVFPGEERILIPSKRDVATYDLRPGMSAPEITEAVLQSIEKGNFGFIVLNFANADMVGHSGNLQATIKAIEMLDACISKIISAVQKKKGHLLITADHGNAEQMIDPSTEKVLTAHTTNPVPLYYLHPEGSSISLRNGILADVAPTILHLMSLKVPSEMAGKNLIVD